MLTATTLALPPRTNIPRLTKKNPKDTPNRVFNKLAWHQIYGTEGVSWRGVEVQDTVSATTGVARVVEVLTTYIPLLPLTTYC